MRERREEKKKRYKKRINLLARLIFSIVTVAQELIGRPWPEQSK